MRYSIEDFNDFENDGFLYQLPTDTMMLINKLSEMVGAPTYQKTPIFSRNNNIKKRNKHDNKNNDYHTNNLNNEWNMLRTFKTTQITKGENKNINEVRTLLNKLTGTNYDKIKPQIISIIDDNQHDEDNSFHQIDRLSKALVNYDLKIKPEIGKTLIWPAEWTHAHRGEVLNSGVKYIITGWMHFPTGELNE